MKLTRSNWLALVLAVAVAALMSGCASYPYDEGPSMSAPSGHAGHH